MKYQSALNASWFIGFDESGNPISYRQSARGAAGSLAAANSGAQASRKSQQVDHKERQQGELASPAASFGGARKANAIASERCFQFAKINRLPANTDFFPDALKLFKSRDEADHAMLPFDDFGDSGAGRNSSQEARRVFEEALLAKRAEQRERGLPAYAFEQRQVFNITRYRNILRYQLGRAANQSILPEETQRQKPRAGGVSKKTRPLGGLSNKAGAGHRLASTATA